MGQAHGDDGTPSSHASKCQNFLGSPWRGTGTRQARSGIDEQRFLLPRKHLMYRDRGTKDEAPSCFGFDAGESVGFSMVSPLFLSERVQIRDHSALLNIEDVRSMPDLGNPAS